MSEGNATPKPMNVFTAVAAAILTPEQAFHDSHIFSPRRIVVFALIVVAATCGALLTSRFHQNDTMRELSYQMSDRQIERFMTGMTEAELAEAKVRAREQISGSQGLWMRFVTSGITTGTSMFLYIIEIWVVILLASPFFGAVEDPIDGKKHKRSSYLAYYAAVPSGLNILATGIIFLLKDPASIDNVLTLEEYSRVTDLSFNLVSLFGTLDVHPLLKYLLDNLTNPLYLWGLAILYFGGRTVLRINGTSKMLMLVGVLVAVLALQSWLFVIISEAIGSVMSLS